MNKIYLLQFFLLLFISCSNEKQFNNAVVSAATPEASFAGGEILRMGGNAIDASVAISFVLGVTEPAMSGLGGGTQLLYSPAFDQPIAINGTTLAPNDIQTDVPADSVNFHRKSTIPSTVKVLSFIHREYGSENLSWSELLQPAIRLARDGFVIGEFRHKVYRKYQTHLMNSPHCTDLLLLEDGSIPGLGDTLKQPILAKTLEWLAAEGPDVFYHGKMAELIAKDMKVHGGWITLEDLHSFPEPEVLKPLVTSYRQFDVYSQPPPCGGWTSLLALNLLEKYPVSQIKAPGVKRDVILAEALSLVHRERREKPITDLVNYHDEIDNKLDKDFAATLSKARATGETTHFSVVDFEGNLVAVTASINAYFGAKAISPQLGFLYNTYMDDFEYGNPEHPFAVRSKAMAYSSMSPTIVKKGGRNLLALGSPGSARIISTVSQCVQLWIDSGLGVEAVVNAPRIHSTGTQIYLESQNQVTKALLRESGFEIAFPTYELMSGNLNPYFGGVHAVAYENGQWTGAADPRRDGRAIVFSPTGNNR